MTAAFAELVATSNFSFLRGASHAAELVETAARLGLAAIGIADRNTLAGVVRAHVAAREHGVRLIVGARLVLRDGFQLVVHPQDREAYGRLSRLLTLGNRRAPKGECHLDFADLGGLGEGQQLIVLPPRWPGAAFAARLEELGRGFPGAVSLALSPAHRGDDRTRFDRLAGLAETCRTPLVATNDVLYHVPERRPLQDVLTCIREHVTIDAAGFLLEPNAERHLKPPQEMARLLSGYEQALQRSLEIAARCRFNLDELKPHYPDEPAGESATPQEELERLAWLGADNRFPQGIPGDVHANIARELRLIGELGYASYFLTVYDIVRFARSQDPPILCQGRGSSANSVVCYCLGITSVNPTEIDLLFERFVSAARGEPPDIDVDFEHERREEVIQYIYARYGRERAGLAATVIRYRARSAVNDVGKAMGLSTDVVGAMSGLIWGWSGNAPAEGEIRQAGLDARDPRLTQTVRLVRQLIDFPRHLSQHVGGFVITRERLDEVVPIANAAMEDRTVVEWDKDDLDALGILKVDVLALGMLTCLRKCFDLLRGHYGRDMGLARVPRDDPATYAMIQKADTVGVFQIESRAQMSMLPRLRPANFYDLVIQIAIVRPGPIQGNMVNPYLQRRKHPELVAYPSPELETVLKKTLGVPLFQEQAMKIAIVGAGFSPDDADRLRRAMASFRNIGTIEQFREKFIAGMIANRYQPDFADRCFEQIKGFSDYGFPESHSASFALLAYASSWLKCHYPEVFACALLNSQPMGFYSSASIVRDLRAHGGRVLPVDVNHSDWDHTLEADEPPARKKGSEGGSAFALRLGLRQVDGLSEEAGEALVAARGMGFADLADLHGRAGLDSRALVALANADAFRSFGLDRRQALWEIKGLAGRLGRAGRQDDLPLFGGRKGLASLAAREEQVELPRMRPGEHVVEDYASLHLSLKAHPFIFLRGRLDARRSLRASDLETQGNGRFVRVAGLVLVRQRPQTAKSVTFLTLEDETGIANIVVWSRIFERSRRIVMGARAVLVDGAIQKEDGVIHVVARQLTDITPELMASLSKDAPSQEGPKLSGASLWRHPRDTRVLPKGRNFH